MGHKILPDDAGSTGYTATDIVEYINDPEADAIFRHQPDLSLYPAIADI
jgi:C4-dicarboxylate transporter